jgi:hypothetical protein
MPDCDTMLRATFKELAELKNITHSISTSTPDLMWAKDLHGRYLWANTQLAYKLYRTDVCVVVGSSDLELASLCKEVQGKGNFTFGVTCANSDTEVLRSMNSMKFLERGLVDGDELILEVHKNVLRDKLGNVIGTTGIGRDVTEEFKVLKAIAGNTKDLSARKAMTDLMYKFWYENPDKGGD